MSLLAALVQASKQWADPQAAAYASGNRAFQVRIERPQTLAEFDRETNTFTNAPDVLIYEGPARIYPASGGAQLDVGDEVLTLSSAQVSIDRYDGEPPRKDDMLTVLSNDHAIATHMVDRTFTVDDVVVGGHFAIGYVMAVSGVAPSRRS